MSGFTCQEVFLSLGDRLVLLNSYSVSAVMTSVSALGQFFESFFERNKKILTRKGPGESLVTTRGDEEALYDVTEDESHLLEQ